MAQTLRGPEKYAEAQCDPCDGTGIYHDGREGDGTGVVCDECEGSGRVVIKYTPFTGRKVRSNIKTVRVSRRLSRESTTVSYEDFLAGKMPAKRE